MFGKGLYFADTFTKALNYSANYWDKREYKLMFLCEVVLGNKLEKF